MATVAKNAVTKVKKNSAPKKPKSHPPYVEMIKEAILALKERTGSSQYAISKYIEDKQKDLPSNFKKLLLVQLKKLVASGKLTKVKNSFKLASIEKPKPKPKASAARKAPPAAKKAVPVEKKVVTKAKAATPVKVKTASAKLKAAVAKKPKATAKVKKTPIKVVKKPKSIKSPAKKVTAKKAKK